MNGQSLNTLKETFYHKWITSYCDLIVELKKRLWKDIILLGENGIYRWNDIIFEDKDDTINIKVGDLTFYIEEIPLSYLEELYPDLLSDWINRFWGEAWMIVKEVGCTVFPFCPEEGFDITNPLNPREDCFSEIFVLKNLI